jgi:hypothetical protein
MIPCWLHAMPFGIPRAHLVTAWSQDAEALPVWCCHDADSGNPTCLVHLNEFCRIPILRACWIRTTNPWSIPMVTLHFQFPKEYFLWVQPLGNYPFVPMITMGSMRKFLCFTCSARHNFCSTFIRRIRKEHAMTANPYIVLFPQLGNSGIKEAL